MRVPRGGGLQAACISASGATTRPEGLDRFWREALAPGIARRLRALILWVVRTVSNPPQSTFERIRTLWYTHLSAIDEPEQRHYLTAPCQLQVAVRHETLRSVSYRDQWRKSDLRTEGLTAKRSCHAAPLAICQRIPRGFRRIP